MRYIITILILFFVWSANAQTEYMEVQNAQLAIEPDVFMKPADKLVNEPDTSIVIISINWDLSSYSYECPICGFLPIAKRPRLETTLLPPDMVARYYFGISYWD